MNHAHTVHTEKFVNLLLMDGKKTTAYKIYMEMLELVQTKLHYQGHDPIAASEVVTQAIQNCMPSLEVRKVRVAGTTYLVPCALPKKRQQAVAMRWIIMAARGKKKNTKLSFAQCLSEEIMDAFFKQGIARTKRNELHTLAEANRAFARYRWW